MLHLRVRVRYVCEALPAVPGAVSGQAVGQALRPDADTHSGRYVIGFIQVYTALSVITSLH